MEIKKGNNSTVIKFRKTDIKQKTIILHNKVAFGINKT